MGHAGEQRVLLAAVDAETVADATLARAMTRGAGAEPIMPGRTQVPPLARHEWRHPSPRPRLPKAALTVCFFRLCRPTQLHLPDKHCLLKAGGGGALTVSLREGTTTIDAIHPPPSAAAAEKAATSGKKASTKDKEREKAEAEAARRKMDSLAAARQCLNVGDSILAVDDVAIASAAELAEVQSHSRALSSECDCTPQ